MKVLIAEDEQILRTVLTGTLKKWGYDPVAVSDGDAAWKALRQSSDAPQLAILDWMMPGMDGVEVCRRARALKEKHPLYIILLTAKDGKEDIIAGLKAGADDYVPKPFDMGELRARVDVGRRMVELQEKLSARVKELGEALEHIKTLQGFLPVCSHCKKVRDDKGYWSQVESYIMRHSKVLFTHTICPTCMTKHYPEVQDSGIVLSGG